MVKFIAFLFPFSSQLKIWPFHVVFAKGRQRNVQKSVTHVQKCCVALSNNCFFRCSRSTKLPHFAVHTTLTLQTYYQSGYIIMQIYIMVVSKLFDLAFLSDDAFVTLVAEVKASLCFQVPVWRWCRPPPFFPPGSTPLSYLRPYDNPLHYLSLTLLSN